MWPLCWSGHVRLLTYRFKTRSSFYWIINHSLVNMKVALHCRKWQTRFHSNKTLRIINCGCKSIFYAQLTLTFVNYAPLILITQQINHYHTYCFASLPIIKPKKIELANRRLNSQFYFLNMLYNWIDRTRINDCLSLISTNTSTSKLTCSLADHSTLVVNEGNMTR